MAIVALAGVPQLGWSENLTPAVTPQAKAVELSAAATPDKLLEQYRTALHQLENARINNQQVQAQLHSQADEKQSLEKQLLDIDVTKQGLVPLILRMVTHLDTFIQMDLPFLSKERQQRIGLLKQMLVKADVTDAEKFRRIMEAFQVENEYGKTIEASKDNIVLSGVPVAVDLLRLGRVALYYQRLDGSEAGYWNKQNKRWEGLDSSYGDAIQKGLRIARKETAPDMLVVPVSVPEAAQ
ncbi:MAG: DUF3450 domain-containing protein [Methylococcaceae bacterium]|nr:DUF3450 domain-containing protein [Methylococcaceae bacterium]